MVANNASKTPALIEIWKVLTQIKTNTEKLVLDMECPLTVHKKFYL